MNAWLTRFTVVMVIASLSGCLTYRYDEYGSKKPDKYYGTQPGYHSLSDYFSVDVVKYLMTFYYIDPATGYREQIGTVQVPWFDRSNYGPREMTYAISGDGKRLVYFDEPNGIASADLYLFDAQDRRKEVLYRNVHRETFGCLDLPRNYIAFGIPKSTVSFDSYVRSTEGVEVSLEARRKQLLEAGKKDQLCDGPL